MKTTYYKSHGSNQAESQTEADPTTGLCYTIHTYRNSRGVIQCEATECTDKGNGMIEYDLMGAKRVRLAESEGKATENKIREVHEAGLKAFALLPAPAAPAYRIEVGQIFFSEGPWEQHRRAVVSIVRPGEFKTVYLDGTRTKTDTHVREYAPSQGIGTYYRQGDKISPEEVNDLLNKATAAEEQERQQQAQERQAAQDERARLIEEGAKLLQTIPAGVTHVIVAELHENTSDMQSDYFNHETKDVVYLAWSSHDRDLFAEMRKGADKFEGTKHLATGPAEIEHREKYSMGSGYYLKDGHSNSSGWAVSKSGVPSLEVLQIAAAKGKLLCTEASPDFYKAGQGATEAPTAPAGTVQVIEHPKRAGKILVIGETYPIRAKLKELGGRWNKWEKGWEYPASDLERITAALTPQAPEDKPEQEISEPQPSSEAQDTATEQQEQPGAAEQMEAAATKLLTMAADHRQAMEEKREDIAQEIEKIKAIIRPEVGTSADGFMRVSGPQTVEQKRKDGDARKAGRTNTSLAAPQMFLF